ncbi:MAG TPA: thermonuclease family protein [Solirubrobacterales bacterium]|nr:thermonuclease family protein [Solirubrobacterales bacterium]
MPPFRRGGFAGSFVLLIVAALVVGRPDIGELLSKLRPGPPPAARAYVIRAVDGDTIEVRLAGHREDVRYIGVDTPETVKPDTPVQCFGPRASRFNHRLVEHRTVRLVFGEERRDVYGRLLAYVYLKRRFVNAMLVDKGLARTLTIPPNDRYAPLFKRLEMHAARAGRGLWSAC